METLKKGKRQPRKSTFGVKMCTMHSTSEEKVPSYVGRGINMAFPLKQIAPADSNTKPVLRPQFT